MSSQQGISPKKSLGRNSKINHFLPTIKPHPLNLLIEDPPLLYWLGTSGCAPALVWVSLSFVFIFFYSHAISLFLPCLILLRVLGSCYPSWCEECGLGLVLPPFIPFVGLDIVLAEAPACPARWASISITPFLAMPMGLPCWPIGFINSSFGLPRPIYFTFTSYCAHGPTSCHSCQFGPLGLLPLFLDFHDPFTLLLPLPLPFLSHLPLWLSFFCHCFFLSKIGINK